MANNKIRRPERSKTIEQRFWPKVLMIPEHSCWEWIGSKNDLGYGSVLYKYRARPAHRVSWEIHFGPIPNGLFVLHKCDNRSCIRPDHLFLGTQTDNMRDMTKKGRRVGPEGEKHPRAKITDKEVKEIRALYMPWKMGYRKLSEKYGISISTVHQIIRKNIWKHVL